ncbi:MAG: hypothetical protein IJK99_09140 [Bacteroidales bacterium]|nr:hypothetical protein [Bacteroidales bacterium]
MNQTLIEEWIIDAYAINKANGFHDASYNDNLRLMMIVTEIGEAIEADRKGRHLDKKAFEIFDFLDGKFKNDEYWKKQGFPQMFAKTVKDTFEDELADVIIRCCDFLGTKNLTFKNAFRKPVEFPNGFYNHFAEKGWGWVRILNNDEFEGSVRVAGLLYEVLWFCKEQGINIEKHVDWKLSYNLTRPRLHGKTY